jgi:hypothetical protein
VTFADLLKRAEAHKAHNRKLEQTPGSGHHDRDTDPTNRARLIAPQHNGLPPVSAHLIAYFDHEYDEAVYMVGPDAPAALDALQVWCKKNTPKNVHDPMPGTHRKILKHVPRLQVETRDGVPVLKMWLSEWNDFLYALEAMGLGVTGAPFEKDDTTP